MAEEETNIEKPAGIPEPEANKPGPAAGSKLERLKIWYAGNKKLSIPVTVLVLILLLAAVPASRYALAGSVVKKNLSLKVLDDTSATPVSGAKVSLGGASADTDAAGVATLEKVSAGPHTVTVTKKYYKDKSLRVTVPLFKQKTVPSVMVTATGRQVKVTVTDAINKTGLGDVQISAAGTTAKTDSSGAATLVLPPSATDQKATFSLKGYNDTTATIKASADKILNNQVSLTPAGKVYFLSKLSGKIDVVKTNLDGSDRQTVLAGTGNEDDRNTVLLASRDWKYLALLSRRAGSNSSLYLIDTSNDSNTVIDEGAADFTLTGWAGDDFIYTVTRSSVQLWQPSRQAIKSFDAAAKKTTTLDQTTASGTGSFDYLSQLAGDVYAYDDQVFYVMNWTSSFGGSSSAQLANKQATFNSVKPDGSAKKAIRSFAPAAGTQTLDITVDTRVKAPDSIALHFSDGAKDNFYTYSGGQVKADASTTINNFFADTFPTYLLSPSGGKTFWSEPRDGKNTLFVGDQEGQNGQQIATLSDYDTYGWYSDNYLLVSKNSSELYVMDKAGKQTALKISDYHKPAQVFTGYGGGYGGL
jgi:hypothetical protein